MRIIGKVILGLSVAALFFGCKGKQTSSTTGWNLNDSKWGGFESAKSKEQMTPPGMVFIEGGAFVMGSMTDNVRYEWHNQPFHHSIWTNAR